MKTNPAAGWQLFHSCGFILIVCLLPFTLTSRAATQPSSLAPVTKSLANGRSIKVVKCYQGGLLQAWCVSFDDGTLGSDWPVLDALRRRAIPATFFLNSLHPQSKDAVAYPDRYAGFEIASHGANHKGLGKMELSTARAEIEQDQKILGEKFHRKIEGFAYPYGDIPKDEVTLKKLHETMQELGIVYARGTQATAAFRPPEDFLSWDPDCGFMSDLDKYLALPTDDSVRVMMSFAHSIDFARGTMSFEKWEKQLDQVVRESRIWKITMSDLMHYITALRALEITDEGVHNPTSLALWIRLNDKPVEIAPGATQKWSEFK